MKIRTLLLLLAVSACSDDREVREYFDSGQLKLEGQYECSQKHGYWISYDAEGDTTKKEFYHKDTLLFTEEFANNVLLRKLDYANEKLTMYHDNGSIDCIVGYRDGKNDGKYICYFPDGVVSREGNYKQGNQVGEFRQYHENGELYLHAATIGEGIHDFYDQAGTLITKIVFENFQPVDTIMVATP